MAEENAEQLFPEVKYQTLEMFHSALAQADNLHRTQRPEPCGVAWNHLQALMNANVDTQKESGEFYRVCGCCFTPPEDD